MLAAGPTPERIALNRVTFGARDGDLQDVQRMGWSAWVEDQLHPPAGDDPTLAQYLSGQTLHIEYDAYDGPTYSWKATKEDRPFMYLGASGADLWSLSDRLRTLNWAEQTRPFDELVSAIAIRNGHSRYQLREVMTDFWLNHFSVSSAKDEQGKNALIVYDRDVIRPNVFGNFRQMLEAVASSVSMLKYLDNAVSAADHPNENYARELMELHSMGRGVYLGKNPGGADVSAQGFTDDDIVQAARALSGWTLQQGQQGLHGAMPNDGAFVFNPAQHNGTAGNCLGANLALVASLGQGRKVLDLVANHPATATFIVTKICRRLFGDAPPQAVIDRGVAAWRANVTQSDQIARTLRAILLDGPEVSTVPPTKVRRPYERVVAMGRAIGAKFTANPMWGFYSLATLMDTPFSWPTPDGRPDANEFWLTTASSVLTWNMLQSFAYSVPLTFDPVNTMPMEVRRSATLMAEYWVGRMVGYRLSDSGMQALTGVSGRMIDGYSWDPQSFAAGLGIQVIAAIACAPEFVLR